MRWGIELRRLTRCALLVATLPAVAVAQDPAQELPPAQQVLDRYAEAIGGRSLWLDRNGWHLTGEFTMTALGVAGTVDIYSASPDRSFTHIVIPGIGEILRGYDGKVGWSLNPLEGPRILEGAELQQLRDEANPAAAVRDTSVIASAETVGRSTGCVSVKLVWKSGRETIDCYSMETGLLVHSTGTATTAMGSAQYTTAMSEYKQFGSYLLPARIAQNVLGQEQVITTHTFEVGPIDSTRFTPPPEIRALIGGGS